MIDKEKLNEYKQRHKEWRDISVTQLSNTNNILLTLSSGLLAFYLVNSKTLHFHLDFSENIFGVDATNILKILT